ncbi:hypothetical protein A6A03_01680 [Chloroflexus islandicus]|uniref:DUF333 domain-containing protein n=1 Tax=Chloroflexus islandicus TaxID=1707952 RepID=A0A178MC19_9CHLR|nr:DUF333 domain-containing protein [Chloroflexus islandicus]OAN46076.1 hypothetical protein A6A03_01680 [Chloroflexus islandicus]
MHTLSSRLTSFARFAMGLVLSVTIAGCTQPATGSPTPAATAVQPSPQRPPTATPVAGLANPASTYCIEQGGQLEIQSTEGGQIGVCRFSDGTVCEEWAFFRGECRPGERYDLPQTAPTEAAANPLREVFAAMRASLPANAFAQFAAQPLRTTDGRQLWMVYSSGMRNFDLTPPVPHVIALFEEAGGSWRELDRATLANPDAEIDYLGDVQQVTIVPGEIWIQIEGGMGAHGGSYYLYRFTGQMLQLELAASAPSPGVGRIEDLNGDGVNEVVLNRSEPYIFCYACGVYYPFYQVYTWQNDKLVALAISELTADQAAPFADLNQQAVAFAQADLWSDALAAINAAVAQAGAADPPTAAGSLRWNQRLIQLIHDAQREAVADSAYPLINHVFYGDYAGAVDLMRNYAPSDIFNPASPLIAGTVADGWQSELSTYLRKETERALAVSPDWAAIYFIQAWGRFLADPADPAIGDDLKQAAALAPDDRLFAETAAWWAAR